MLDPPNRLSGAERMAGWTPGATNYSSATNDVDVVSAYIHRSPSRI